MTRARVFDALEAGDLDLVGKLTSSVNGIHATDEWGATLLMNATRDGHTALALQTIAVGADVNHVSMSGGRPLGVAAMAGDVAVGRALLDAGADANAEETDPDGTSAKMTALLWATNRRHVEFVELLLEHGADINKVNGASQAAVMFAADGTPESNTVLEALLKRRPDIHVRDWRGRNLIDEADARAVNSNSPEMKALLKRYFPDVHFQTGDSPSA